MANSCLTNTGRSHHPLRTRVEKSLSGITADELDAHFNGMSARYWERVGESELIWGLNMIHCFLQKLVTSDGSATTPVLGWRHFPAQGFTKAMICTWDRHGLLAKAAAAFNSVQVNIIQADAYTRADHIVLDVFRVCNVDHGPITDPVRFHQMHFLLEGALSQSTQPAFSPAAAPPHPRRRSGGPPARVSFDNEDVAGHTVMTVEAPDRLGLLYDILQALADCGLNVAQALVDTDEQMARDVFHITDLHGRPISHPSQLGFIRDHVLAAIA